MSSKASISTLVQCFSLTALVVILWLVFILSLAFGQDALWGRDFSHFFLQTATDDILSGDIPLTIFVLFQFIFVFLTPILIIGAFSKQINFSTILWFAGLWLILVYAPMLLLTHVIFSSALI